MVKEFTILISDKNKNVREYLRREMAAEGYRVLLAKSAREVLEWIYRSESIDLLILDPQLLDADEMHLINKINDRLPSLPVIVHSFSLDYPKQFDFLGLVSFVEKEGKSIEHLKKAISELLDDPIP